MNPNEWPHKFTKNGREYVGFPEGVMFQPLICVHCYKEYVGGLQEAPPNPCPARTTSKEMKRLKVS